MEEQMEAEVSSCAKCLILVNEEPSSIWKAQLVFMTHHNKQSLDENKGQRQERQEDFFIWQSAQHTRILPVHCCMPSNEQYKRLVFQRNVNNS